MLKIYRSLKSNYITQRWGTNGEWYRSNGINLEGHNGFDFKCWKKEPIYHSVNFNGWVKVENDNKGGIGVNLISNEKIDGYYYKIKYWHLLAFAVHDEQQIKPGDLIGWGNSTGFSTGDHLHFGIKKCDKYGNPISIWNGYFGAEDPEPYFENVFILDVLEIKKKALSVIELAKKVIFEISLWLKGRSIN